MCRVSGDAGVILITFLFYTDVTRQNWLLIQMQQVCVHVAEIFGQTTLLRETHTTSRGPVFVHPVREEAGHQATSRL